MQFNYARPGEIRIYNVIIAMRAAGPAVYHWNYNRMNQLYELNRCVDGTSVGPAIDFTWPALLL